MSIALDHHAGNCRLVVRDNGCGFDPAAPRRKERFGLLNLTEQVRHLGGDLSIHSVAGQGVELYVHVPGLVSVEQENAESLLF